MLTAALGCLLEAPRETGVLLRAPSILGQFSQPARPGGREQGSAARASG